MKFTNLISAALVVATLMFAAPLLAAEGGDAAAGKEKKSMCAGCHGIPGYHTAYPEVYRVPKLGGQHPAYIIAALKEYKSGARKFSPMNAIASSLSEKDMADLAAYYGAKAATTAAK